LSIFFINILQNILSIAGGVKCRVFSMMFDLLTTESADSIYGDSSGMSLYNKFDQALLVLLTVS
jgi:hypothetical protein